MLPANYFNLHFTCISSLFSTNNIFYTMPGVLYVTGSWLLNFSYNGLVVIWSVVAWATERLVSLISSGLFSGSVYVLTCACLFVTMSASETLWIHLHTVALPTQFTSTVTNWKLPVSCNYKATISNANCWMGSFLVMPVYY